MKNAEILANKTAEVTEVIKDFPGDTKAYLKKNHR